MHTRAYLSVVAALAAVVASGGCALPAQAVQTAQDRIVSADPVNWTPNVQDGAVRAVVQVGNDIVLGGNFTTVAEPGGSTVTRDNILAFDATTGKIDTSFVPAVDGEVKTLVAAPDGKSVYIGGDFTHVDGVTSRKLARLDIGTGALTPGFKAPAFDGEVKDLRLSGGKLYVAGSFTKVGVNTRVAMARLDAATGAFDPTFDLGISGVHSSTTGGTTAVWKADITPDGRRMVVIGNFGQVLGAARNQIAMIDLSNGTPALANWYTPRYAAACSSSFDTYLRDVDFSPDGSYFVVGATGAYSGGPNAGVLCDAVARFETYATGTNIQPTWVDYTGGDTITAVAVTGTAVYAGGHQRWENNPFASDKAGQGAVDRQGLAALDPVNGLPFSWNPGRARGVGVWDLYATDQGLWVGHDTSLIGGETHGKIALFPSAGGETVPEPNTGTLPGQVYTAGGTQPLNPTDTVTHRSFDGTTVGAAATTPNGGIAWSNARGAFMINGTLYYGWSDGSFSKRSFDGTTFGAASPVATADKIVSESAWHTTVKSITGMFFANGRIYYTRSGAAALYSRYFEPESDIVGAQEFTVTGNLSDVDWRNVAGMFLAGGKLYYVTANDGALHRVDFAGGVPVAGTSTVVDSAHDWRARAVFLYAGKPHPAPHASFTSLCQGLDCAFDASASSDPDGTITSYAWDFGDGATATGATPHHTYGAAGTYAVKLTVTDEFGGTATATQQLQVSTVPSAQIAFRATAGVNTNSSDPAVQIPASVQAGDGMLLVFTSNTSNATVPDPTGVTGWRKVDTIDTGSAVSIVWQKVAAAGDAGRKVDVKLSAAAKVDLRVLAYAGTDSTAPVAAYAKAVDGGTVTSHTTPQVTVPGSGSWVVSLWSDKSSSTTAWTAPAGVAVRATGIGSGSGRVTALLADSNGTVPTDSYGGFTATTDAASKALMWTIVLAPGT